MNRISKPQHVSCWSGAKHLKNNEPVPTEQYVHRDFFGQSPQQHVSHTLEMTGSQFERVYIELTLFSLLFFVKSSETKRDFHQELLTTACPFCIFAFESGLKVANQQPCRKVCTVIFHCNFKCNNYE